MIVNKVGFIILYEMKNIWPSRVMAFGLNCAADAAALAQRPLRYPFI